jgi:hypothetical protein
MSFIRWLLDPLVLSSRTPGRATRPASKRKATALQRTFRPCLECLEDRAVPAIIAGPDAFGYQASTHAFEAIDLVAGQPGVTVLFDYGNVVDDNADVISLGANTFNFYGFTYTGSEPFTSSSLYASTNGLLSFSGHPNGEFINTDLTYEAPNEMGRSRDNSRKIAPLWDDWITSRDLGAQVLTKMEPDRLIIEWSNIRSFNIGLSGVTFQAILELNTGSRPADIIFNYVDLDTGDFQTDGANATVGIMDTGNTGPNPLLVSFNALSPYVGDAKAILISFGVNTTTTVTAADATYNGLPHSATAIVTPGSLAGATTFLYTGTGATVYNSSAAPINAGSYHVIATFTPDDLSAYHSSSGSANYTISKATLTGNATTQNVLNLAQGTVTITVSNVSGLASSDTLASFLSTAHYYITVGTIRYEFVPTTVTTSGSSITIAYTLRNSALLGEPGAALDAATSGATAITAGFDMESLNYTFTDDYLTRLFSTVH